MSEEALAFLCGLVAMSFVWFVYDAKYNPYMKGYADGLKDGIKETMHFIDEVMSERRAKHEQ